MTEEKNRELTTYSYISNHLWFEYFVGFEITALLGYKNTRQVIKNCVSKFNQLVFRDYPGIKEPNLDPRVILLTRDGVIEILLKTRKLITPDVEYLLQKFGIKTTNKKCLTKEQNTLSNIAKIFKIEKIDTQVPVGTYYLDMYFPDYKMVIECDELGHFDRDPKDERERVEYINTALGIDDTHWVRFNPDSESFDMSRLVGDIYMCISRLRDGKIIQKVCCTCRNEKLSTEFSKSKNSPDGYGRRCRECQKKMTEKMLERKKMTVEEALTIQEKVCSRCKENKPLIKYSKSKMSKDGYGRVCKACDSLMKKTRKHVKIPEFKKCSACEDIKKNTEFFVLKYSKDGLNGRCKKCMKERTEKWRNKNRREISEKTCSRCGETKSPSDFYKNNQSLDGLYSCCKKCHN